ncbi:hypothetical protein DB31_3242 [Hyalangium minutum]|uniref:Uncharacterized protein n=1 Tax=Hyalangium minutum TaxID=394096 RepID=A0A085WTU9_9BACT|nr:hypothetical protein DB31_3242 [Hyalangium minutum]
MNSPRPGGVAAQMRMTFRDGECPPAPGRANVDSQALA